VKERTKQIQHLLHQKDEFINQLSHDLKTPLTPMMVLLPLLKEKIKNKKDTETFDVVLRNVYFMKDLVSKTIDLAKLNSGIIEFDFETIKLNEELEFIIGNNQVLFDKNVNNPQESSFSWKIIDQIVQSFKSEADIEDTAVFITNERYNLIMDIMDKIFIKKGKASTNVTSMLDDVLTDKYLGIPIFFVSLWAIFTFTFTLSEPFVFILEEFFSSLSKIVNIIILDQGIASLIIGIINGLGAILVFIPNIFLLYFALAVFEDSGYLARAAFIVDKWLEKIGLHGKAFIPLMLGYGCNVPACLGCRIMETYRERLISIFVTTLIPCAAVTTIILGLVGKYVGLGWAILLYIIDLIIIFILGRIAFKVLPGEPTGLIMEMHSYKIPHLKTLLEKTWFKVKDFIYIAFPLIIVCSFLIKVLEVAGLLGLLENLMNPISVDWLGLPSFSGIALIFGIPRKELTLIMLAARGGTTNFAEILTSDQMIIFSLVTMLYIPCIATVAALIKEIGWKKALLITIFEILFAIVVGGIAFRFLRLI